LAGSGLGARTVASDHLGKDLPVKRSPLAALALLLALACASCSDDDPEPKIAPPESSSPAPTETETTSEPPEPLDPEETVRAWVEARNVTVHTGNAKAVYGLSTDGCTTCSNSVEPIRQVYKDGGRLETFGWRVQSVERKPDFDSSGNVAAALVFTAGRTFPTANADPVVYDEEKHILLFRLKQDGQQWKIDHFAYAS
jgi:hypothetical protein